jgi:class 3 adenylate cyclase/tetratricopeptide (TPR) repeat protein
MDIAAWLRDLDLERYVSAFCENEIDWKVLPKLTSEDLREIGVAAVGHRRKLLDAIAALGPEVPAAALTTAPSDAPTPVEAERRQLTVMFCDLVGSTPLATRYDPEDLREIVGAYHRCVADTVAPFAGFVAKYMGDGVLIYFGYPEAHEDDAERAVRAGLAVIAAVGEVAAPEPLNVRLGIATGLVVVGDLIGAGAAQERGVVGETPNLAARLQALARPGTLVIADNTRRQIGALFDIEDLGPQALAGFGEPQHVWRVSGESGVLSRFEALRSEATPLVGRDEELDLLLRRWQQAQAGEGRAVLISGEAGIGKSRLTAALSERIEDEPHTRVRYFCSPHHQDSALYPFIAQLEHAAGFARDDTPEEKLGKLKKLLRPAAPGDDEMALLAELLSLPNAAAELNLSPQRKREMLFEALLHQLEALSRDRPVLMVFEDAHWIDPTSRELLDLTVDRVRRMPVLLIVTFRPEFQQAWGGQPHVTVVALNRLGERDVAVMVRELSGNAPLGSEIVEEIVERTDGVPLFIEELTKAVLERAFQDNRVAAVLSASPLPALAVPSTLHASLIARLDRIGAAAKEVAQTGAILGREFSYELIQRVAQRSEIELQAALARLTEAGLLFCRGVPPHASYLFKHALVQDAAYGTLLRTRRQELHARVAAVLEEHFADLVERQPELLAHHLMAAGDTNRAAAQWLKAGQHAAACLAHVEAIAHLERGLALLRALPEAHARDALELDVQLALGVSYITVKGMGAPEVRELYERARKLAEGRGDQKQLFQSLYGLWQSNSGSGQILSARLHSQRLLQLTAGGADSGLRLQAHHSAWTTLFLGGSPAEAREHTEAGWRLYDLEEHRSHRHLYGGHDPGVCALQTGAQLEWLLGYPDRAVARIAEAQALGERIAHPFSMEIAVTYAAMIHLNRGEPELAFARLAAAEALAAEQRVSFIMEPLFLRGAAFLEQGAAGKAVDTIREGLAPGRPVATIWQPFVLSILAEALRRRGDYQEAHAAISQGLDTMNATGERMWNAELHRVRGLVLLTENKQEESAVSFEQALQTARGQQARSLELRAATSLARLWGEQGQRAEALELLAPVYDWFSEGFDTADLKEAAALLAELA